jgi:hypothetical protein
MNMTAANTAQMRSADAAMDAAMNAVRMIRSGTGRP